MFRLKTPTFAQVHGSFTGAVSNASHLVLQLTDALVMPLTVVNVIVLI